MRRMAWNFITCISTGRRRTRCASISTAQAGVVIDGPGNRQIHKELADMVQMYEQNGSESVLASSGRIYRMLTLLDNPVLSPQLKKHGDAINRAVR